MTNKDRILKAMIPGAEYKVWELQTRYYGADRLLRDMAVKYKEDKFAPPITKIKRGKYICYKKLY